MKAFSSTSEEWLSRISDNVRLSMRCGSLTHLANKASWTFRTSTFLICEFISGCVVMSKKKKFCFSVVKTPFSTRFFARRSLTFFSWKRNFMGFHVSPELVNEKTISNLVVANCKLKHQSAYHLGSLPSFAMFRAFPYRGYASVPRPEGHHRLVLNFLSLLCAVKGFFCDLHTFQVQFYHEEQVQLKCTLSDQWKCSHSKRMYNPKRKSQG